MEKKQYQKPECQVIILQHQSQLMQYSVDPYQVWEPEII